MFTGIIAELGKVIENKNNSLLVASSFKDIKEGESIAVNGVCLTATAISQGMFKADVSPATVQLTTLSALAAGDEVNLERAVSAGSLMGGHIVQGHADGMVSITGIYKRKDFFEFRFSLDKRFAAYIVAKGSVAIDGVSLTVSEVKSAHFSVWIIPETYKKTNLHLRKEGDSANIECDIVAKYIEKQMQSYKNSSPITRDLLESEGYI